MVLPAARPAARSHWGAVVRRLPVDHLMPHLVHRLLAAVLGLLLTVSGLAAAVLPAQASQPSTTAGSMTSASTGVTPEVTRAAIAAKGKPTFVTASNKARPGQLSGVVAPAELSGTRYHQLLAHQVAMRATGPMTKSASATAPGSVTPLSHGALLPGPPPAACPGRSAAALCPRAGSEDFPGRRGARRPREGRQHARAPPQRFAD